MILLGDNAISSIFKKYNMKDPAIAGSKLLNNISQS